MEAISKLYAEIGFKINKSGLDEFSKKLSDVQKQIKDFSSSIKEIPGINIKATHIVSQSEKREQVRKEREEKRKQKEKEKENKRFERSLNRLSNDLVKGLGGLFIFALSSAKKIFGMGVNGSAIGMGMRDFSLLTGINTQELLKWSSVGAAVGVPGGSVRKMMENIAMNAAKLRLGEGGAADAFKKLGIGAADDAGAIFGKLIYAVRNRNDIDEATMSAVLSELGIEPAQMKKMADATEEQLERAKLLYNISPTNEQIYGAATFRSDITSLGEAIDSVKVKIANAFNDVDPNFINNILKALSDPELNRAIHSFAEVVIGTVKGLINGIKWLYDTGGKLGKVVGDTVLGFKKPELSGIKDEGVKNARTLYELTHFNERPLESKIVDELARKYALARAERMTQISGPISVYVKDSKDVGPVLGSIQKETGQSIVTETTRAFGDTSLQGIGVE